MNRYTVVWDDNVQAAFEEAWISSNSENRAVLREIADWIDSKLAQDPDQLGADPSDDGTLTLTVPLTSSAAIVTTIFQILPLDRLVRVVLITCKAPLV